MSGLAKKVRLEDVAKIELPGGSWSRMVLNDKSVSGNQGSLGYSIFTPGTVLSPVAHEVEELAIVIAGTGELRLEEDVIHYAPGDALFIPAGVWHAVANTGNEDVIMVFAFPYPDYPVTERK
ncbi:MAG: cupin domain-containing protein [Anaerolineaceae bacterium]|nr:cupin domain-containing protein [Anaerolineaceae bacterium]